MSVEDPSVVKMVLEYAAAGVAFLLGVVYKKHEADLITLGARVDRKADRMDVNSTVLRMEAKMAEDIARAEDQRKELQAGVERIYAVLDEHRKDTQTKFDAIISAIHANNVSTLKELNNKVDK